MISRLIHCIPCLTGALARKFINKFTSTVVEDSCPKIRQHSIHIIIGLLLFYVVLYFEFLYLLFSCANLLFSVLFLYLCIVGGRLSHYSFERIAKLNKIQTRRSATTNRSTSQEALPSFSPNLPLPPIWEEEELNMAEEEPNQPPRRTLHDYLANT